MATLKIAKNRACNWSGWEPRQAHRYTLIMQGRIILAMLNLLLIFASGCQSFSCLPTDPVWLLAPEDSAVANPPAEGYYFVNDDRSIWASASWAADEGFDYDATEGIKVGWFRPAGEKLIITGRRLDAFALPLDAHVPCCYPTRFQATGLIFPTPGCWEITATAGDSSLTFVVRIEG